MLTGGEVGDVKGYAPIMAEPGPEPKVLLADKGCDADAILADLDAKGVAAVIPPKRNRKNQRPSTATSTRSETSSNAASQSSSTAADWRPDTTRPPAATSASSLSHQPACGSGTSSTEPNPLPGLEHTRRWWLCGVLSSRTEAGA